MNQPNTLQEQLTFYRHQHRRQKLYSGLAKCWAACAVASLAVLALGQATGFAWSLIGVSAAALATLVFVKVLMVDWLTLAEIVRLIERHHPGLNKLLETASEQIAKNDPDKLDYLQQRVLTDALKASREQGWELEANGRLALTHLYHGAALSVFLLAFWQMSDTTGSQTVRSAKGSVMVEPGDVEVERGTSLIVSAKFTSNKSDVKLVVKEHGRDQRWMTMVQSLDDPTYSYRLANVQSNAVYSVVSGGQQSDLYRMTVFEYPELKSSQARLDYPEFTGREDKVINNTRRLTAVEGTGLTFDFQFNKPLKSAVLKAREGEGDDIPLKQLADGSPQFQHLRNFSEPGEFRYELHLEDVEGRVNRFPSRYVFNVLENAAPALKFEAPAGDTEVSAIEEMRLQGVARDDFGLADAGFGYQLAGEEPQYVSLTDAGLATNKLDVAHVLRMEDLGVEVGQVVSYFLWADDRGPDGSLRRGFSDLFFATVRPFEEIFRQNRSATEGMRQQQQQQGEGGEQGGEQQQSIANLLDTQKDIISATWNLKRRDSDDEKLAEDIQVVLDSQGELLGMLEQASALLQDSESGGQAYQANEAMEAAADSLAKAKDASGEAVGQALSDAIIDEQTALQHLQQLRENEFRVSRQQARQQRQQQQGRGNSNRAQRQLDQLEMQDTRNNYELESKAERQQQQAQQQGERAEQRQTLNRLKELARRQSDLNKRLQELQIALLDAEDEVERERIERELKRLQDEQRDLIDDLDEVQQRMDSSQNDELAESRQQLEEAREQMEETARNLQQQQLSQAANSGSRASRNLDEVREDYKEQTANEFADAMREMRQDARELDNNQNELDKAIEEDRQKTFRSLSDEGDLKEALDMAESQKGQLDELLQQMEQVSREAEDSEKLLSQELEDGVRRARQENMEESLDQLSLLMRNNLPNETGDIQRELTENISELRGTVEDAAEKIIGSDEDAMRFAADRLNELREEVEREMEQAMNERPGQQRGREGERDQEGDGQNPRGQGQRPQEGEPREGSGGQQDAEQQENQQQQGRGQRQPGGEAQENQQRQGRGQAQEEQQDRPGQGQGRRPNDQDNPQTAQGRGGQPRDPNDLPDRRPDGNRENGGSSGGSDRFRDLDNFDFDGPLTGLDYRDWEDRLREVEEVIEIPELRNQVSEVRQRARDIRRENKENGKPPKWDLVDMQILRPMTEINKRLEQELSLRQPKRELVPVDHDPVPEQYSELVRRYYERLGGRKEKNSTDN
ncbi:MAG: hypothetical protein MKZ85_04485 [Pedosphaera sp.]|nr:hypothetical protein [Pedosphaera sp.]